MSKENEEKQKLLRQLEQVDARLQVLDMIDARLQKMKVLAERVAREELEEEEMQSINGQVQELAKEVQLLDTAPTEYTYYR